MPEALPTLTPVRLGDPARTPRITIGLLTWNPDSTFTDSLRSILAQDEPAVDFLWLDNASQHGALDDAVKQFPQLGKPAVNPRNRGFAPGHNQLIAACRTPYYLALNQDAVLAPNYIRQLADWLDENPKLALASGLILQVSPSNTIQSAGLAYPRNRASFMVGLDEPADIVDGQRRIASGVVGAAMLLRLEACRAVSIPEPQVLSEDFFAYHEELDLAQRLGRAGYQCGVDETVIAHHGLHSSGGRRQFKIAVKYFANHWMLSVRHDPLDLLLGQLPWLLYGELRWWSLHYLKNPAAFIPAIFDFLGRIAAGRRFYHAFERNHGPTRQRLLALRSLAAHELRTFQHKQIARRRHD